MVENNLEQVWLSGLHQQQDRRLEHLALQESHQQQEEGRLMHLYRISTSASSNPDDSFLHKNWGATSS